MAKVMIITTEITLTTDCDPDTERRFASEKACAMFKRLHVKRCAKCRQQEKIEMNRTFTHVVRKEPKGQEDTWDIDVSAFTPAIILR